MKRCPMSRRQFLTLAGGTAGLALTAGLFRAGEAKAKVDAVVAAASGRRGPENARKAIEALGGMGTFVSRGDVVVLKPNIGWDRTPEQAANTDPEVVVALAELCLAAGAKKVRVFDRTCNDPRRCYASSGIQVAVERFAKQAHAEGALIVEQVDKRKFVKIGIPGGETLKEWELYRDSLEADKIVNVPIAKHHSLAVVTLGLKNMMGVMGGDRGQIHYRLADCLVDVNRMFPRQLIVVDATRILLRNGPSGGDLGDVKAAGKLFASRDVVAADVVAAERLFGLAVKDVPHIARALGSGIGVDSPARIKVVEC